MEEHCINHKKLEGSAFLTTYSRTDMPLNPGLKAQWKEKSVNIWFKNPQTNPKQWNVSFESMSGDTHWAWALLRVTRKQKSSPVNSSKLQLPEQSAKELTKTKINTQNTSEGQKVQPPINSPPSKLCLAVFPLNLSASFSAHIHPSSFYFIPAGNCTQRQQESSSCVPLEHSLQVSASPRILWTHRELVWTYSLSCLHHLGIFLRNLGVFPHHLGFSSTIWGFSSIIYFSSSTIRVFPP